MNPGRIILRNLKASEGLSYGKLWAVHRRRPPSTAFVRDEVGRSSRDRRSRGDRDSAEGARDAVNELCATGKAASIILIPGGFAETGQSALDEEIRGALLKSRSRVTEGRSWSAETASASSRSTAYNTFFVPYYKLPFHDAPGDRLVAISQSGAYLVSLTSNLDGIVSRGRRSRSATRWT